MNNQILKAHALFVQGKLSAADYDALILGYVAGDRKVKYTALPYLSRTATREGSMTALDRRALAQQMERVRVRETGREE